MKIPPLLLRGATIAGVAIGLLLPLLLIEGKIVERRARAEGVAAQFAAETVREQSVAGPLLALTCEETDEQKARFECPTRFFAPRTLKVDGAMPVETRYRGIYGFRLYRATLDMFATLFVYGSNGQVLWLVMSDGRQQGDGSFTGALYRTQGNGAFNTVPWPGVTVGQVGSMTLRFNNGESGTLTYTVNGTTVTKSIIRQVFSSPVPVCSN